MGGGAYTDPGQEGAKDMEGFWGKVDSGVQGTGRVNEARDNLEF